MAQTEKGLLFFYDWRGAFEDMSGDECKQMLLDMLDYSQNDTEEPQAEKYEGMARMAARFIFPAITRSKTNARAGRAGGLATASRTNASSAAISDALSAAESSATSKPQAQDKTITRQNKNQDRRQDDTETERSFAVFWQHYPKQVRREDARKAWFELRPDKELCQKIIDAIDRQKETAQWKDKDGQYIPLAMNWLERKSWEDTVISAQKSNCFKPSTGVLRDFPD